MAFLSPVAPGELTLWRGLAWAASLISAFILGLGLSADALALIAPEVHRALEAQRALSGPDRLYQEALLFGAVTLGEALCAVLMLWISRGLFLRAPWTFVAPARPWSWRMTLIGASIGVMMVALIAGLDQDPADRISPPVFDTAYPVVERVIYALGLAPVVLLATAAEEILFRGILTQVLSGLTRNRLVLALFSGAIFALAHGDPSPAGLAVRWALGAAWTWSVLELAGLEFALGAHFFYDWLILTLAAPPSTGIGKAISWSFSLQDSAITLGLLVVSLAGVTLAKRLQLRSQR